MMLIKRVNQRSIVSKWMTFARLSFNALLYIVFNWSLRFKNRLIQYLFTRIFMSFIFIWRSFEIMIRKVSIFDECSHLINLVYYLVKTLFFFLMKCFNDFIFFVWFFRSRILAYNEDLEMSKSITNWVSLRVKSFHHCVKILVFRIFIISSLESFFLIIMNQLSIL